MLLVVAERCVIGLVANKFDEEEKGSLVSLVLGKWYTSTLFLYAYVHMYVAF